MNDDISSGGLRTLCVEFARQVEPENIHIAARTFDTTDPRGAQGTGNTAERHGELRPTFASLVVQFINRIAVGAECDLTKFWLLHRLQSLVIEHQQPRPGEIEMLRADIAALLIGSSFSKEECEMISAGFEQILISLGPRTSVIPPWKERRFKFECHQQQQTGEKYSSSQ